MVSHHRHLPRRGGTSGEARIALDRTRRGDLRRRDPVAEAGLIEPATLTVRLGLEMFVDATVPLGGRVGDACPGAKSSRWWGRSRLAARTSITPTRCGRGDAEAVAISGNGALDARHLPAVVHLRQSVRSMGDSRDHPAGVASRCRTGGLAGDHRLEDTEADSGQPPNTVPITHLAPTCSPRPRSPSG
jgi:hypothetical protein